MKFRQSSTHLVEAIQTLIADRSAVDVRVRCKDHQPSDGLGAHRLILAAASPDFLKLLLLDATSESEGDELICLHLPDYSSSEMGPIMSLIYYGEVWITESFALDCQKILQDLKIAVELDQPEQDKQRIKVKREPFEDEDRNDVKDEKHHIKIEPTSDSDDNLNDSVLTTPENEVAESSTKAFVSCDKCSFKTTSLSSLQSHRLVHARRTERLTDQKTCPVCQLLLDSPKAIRDHALESHSEVIKDTLVQCIVDENCKWKKELGDDNLSKEFFRHLKDSHKCEEFAGVESKKVLKCDFPQCDYETTKGYNLTQHFRCHNNEKRHKCPICSQGFVASSHLRNHVKSQHTKERNFQCPKCPRAFVTSWQAKCHMKSNHGTKSEYSCKQCLLTFKTPQSYAGHVKSAHKGSSMSKTSSKVKKICEVCGQALVKNHLCSQSPKDNKKVTCTICQKSMESKSMKAHIQYHRRMEVSKYLCQFCNRSFTTGVSLKRHILIHQNLKPYTCAICEKSMYFDDVLQISEIFSIYTTIF